MMDEKRLARIEDHLLELLRVSLPRAEFDHKFEQLQRQLNKATHELTAVKGELKRLEAVDSRLEEHEGRLGDVETVTIPAKSRHARRVWFWPTLATALGVVTNAGLAFFTWFASHGSSHH